MGTSTGKGRVAFPSTHWTSIARAADESPGSESKAMERFLARYLPAIRSFLIQSGLSEHDAEDLAQDFVADKIIGQHLLRYPTKERGRFRNFLLRALVNYHRNKIQFDRRARRAPGKLVVDIDDDALITGIDCQPSRAFDVAWAREVIAEAVVRMHAECEAKGRSDIWEVFKCRIIDPTLRGSKPIPYRDLVQRFGLKRPKDACNVLVTGKRMYIRFLRSVIAEYTQSSNDIDAEIGELKAILSLHHQQ